MSAARTNAALAKADPDRALPPGLKILSASVDSYRGQVRFRVRTHCAQVFDLILPPQLARAAGHDLMLQGEALAKPHAPEAAAPILKPGGRLL